MTEEQKFQIRVLRNQGQGYKKIADQLWLRSQDVQDYCRQRHLNGPPEIFELNKQERIRTGNACEYCFGPFLYGTHKIAGRFCSELCRQAYVEEHSRNSEDITNENS